MRTPRAPGKKNTAGPILIQPDPPAQLVEQALDALMQDDLAGFANALETAREMYAKFPELVTAPGFPEDLRKAYIEEYEHEPDGSCESVGMDVFEPGHRESLRPRAIDIARGWHERQKREQDQEGRQ